MQIFTNKSLAGIYAVIYTGGLTNQSTALGGYNMARYTKYIYIYRF